MADGVVTEAEKLAALSALALILYRIGSTKPVLLMLYPDPYQGSRPDEAEAAALIAASCSSVARLVDMVTGPVRVLDLGDVLGPAHFEPGDIHPNKAGYAAMARAALAVISGM